MDREKIYRVILFYIWGSEYLLFCNSLSERDPTTYKDKVMTKREVLSKKIRFEVFKRDSFKCKYCGKSAPEVKLEVDHIKAVSKGGDNSMFNLVTSCFDCNRGKSNKSLSDKKEMSMQKEELDKLNDDMEQFKMLREWRDEIMSSSDEVIEFFNEQIENKCECKHSLNNTGLNKLKKWIKKYEHKLLLESIDASFDSYYKTHENKDIDSASFNKAFEAIPKIAYNKTSGRSESQKEMYYCRKILINRLNFVDERKSITMLNSMIDFAGFDEVKEICCECENWTEFRKCYEEMMEMQND